MIKGFKSVFLGLTALFAFLTVLPLSRAEESVDDLRKPLLISTPEKEGGLSEMNAGASAGTAENTGLEAEAGAESNEEEIISVNFENVDIRDVIRILADKAQINMVVGPDVAATVNIQLNNVSWQKALNVILMTHNLTYRRDGDLIRIITLDQLQQEDQKVPLVTEIVVLNFARAAEVKPNFENMLTSRGRIDVNERTNSLLVTDIPDAIKKIKEIAIELDTRTPQVMIEALLADVVIDQDDQLGVNWSLAQEIPGNQAGPLPEKSVIQGTIGSLFTGGAIRFGTTILADKDLKADISFLQSQRRVNVLAHPQILTLDNLAAHINLTEEIPYQQQTQSTESASALQTTAFKEAGITLSVTPHITTKDNYIYLKIDVKQSFQSGTTNDNQPIVDTRAASTNLLVKNRETAVIGGLRRKNDSFTVTKFPILGDIPLLGSAFRKRVKDLTDTDLIIFVTPSIVKESVLTDKEENRLELFDEETEDWTNQFDLVKKRKQAKQKRQDELPQPQRETLYLRPPTLTK